MKDHLPDRCHLLCGLTLSSLFEGASGFKITSCEFLQKSGSCLVQFSRNDAEKKALSWQDRVYVIHEPRG